MMTRDAFEAVTQIIILHCGANDEVAHLLSKLLDHDAEQRQRIEELEKENGWLAERDEVAKWYETLVTRAEIGTTKIPSLRAYIEHLEQQNITLQEALALLYSVQNGCPLPKYQADWDRAMQLTQRILKETDHEPLPPDAPTV